MNQPELDAKSPDWKRLALAGSCGCVFGFLLQKGGVAKYHLLEGVLLFQDFTVIKVMVSAIIVGMIGVFSLRALGKAELKIKPTRLGSNIAGGLIFGVGFGLSGYCPGTGAAALGQMNWDAIFMAAGMVAGSYAFAMSSDRLDQSFIRRGDYGKVLLPNLFRARLGPFAVALALALAAGLWALEHFAG